MTQAEINESQWRDPANWRFGVYRSARDTRVWVPKPIKWMGWTLNFAHTAAWWQLAALLFGPLAVVSLCVIASGG